MLQDGDQDALTRYRRATRNLLFADGRQHIDWSLKDKTWKDIPTRDGRIPITNNYIKPILRSRAQRLLSTELNWRIVTETNAHEEKDRAVVGTNFLEARWRGVRMDAKARQAVFLADNCGVAFLKQFWNPNIGPLTAATVIVPHPATGELAEYPVDQDGNVLADEMGNPLQANDQAYRYRPGDTDTALRSIFNVRLNPDAMGLEPAEGFRYLLDSEVLPISVIKERWKERAKGVQSNASVGMMQQYERIVRSVAGRTTPGNDLLTGRDGKKLPDKDLALYTEYWEAPTESMSAGRLIVVAGDELLFPQPGEAEGLPQGIVPFVAIYSERRPLDWGGRPVVDDMIDPQKVINREIESIVQEMTLSGVGQWAMFDIPGLSDQITNAAAAHIKVPLNSAFANRGIGELIQRIQASGAGADRWRLIEEAKKTLFDIAAFHEIQRGQVPPGVDSGVAVQLLQEAENGQMHDSVRDLKASFIAWAHQTLTIGRWGYGDHEERFIPQERPDLGFLVESVKGIDLPDPDTVTIELEGFRPQSKAAFNAEIKEAMAQGWIAPRDGIKAMDLGRGVEGLFESQTRHYARARRQNLAIEKGEFKVIPPPPEAPHQALGIPYAFIGLDGGAFVLPQDDDHLIAIDVHQEIALNDTKPLKTRQAALMLIAERRAFLQVQLAATAATPAGDANAKPKSPTPSDNGASNAT